MDTMTFDVPWIEIGGVPIRAPVTAGTNAIIAAQCAAYFWHSRRTGTARAQMWGSFFLSMALATTAGVVKHGLPHLIPPGGFQAVLWISNIAGGFATWFAQRATIVSRGPRVGRSRLCRLADAQLGAFVAANVVLGPDLLLLLLDMALGLLPVMVVEAVSFWRRTPGSGAVAGGLSISLLTGAVYLTEVSVGPWLSHIDIAHCMMMGSFFLIVRGTSDLEHARTDAWPDPGGVARSVPEGGAP